MKKILGMTTLLSVLIVLFAVSANAVDVNEPGTDSARNPPYEEQMTALAPIVDDFEPIDLPPADISALQANDSSAAMCDDIIYPDGVTFLPASGASTRSIWTTNYSGAVAANYAQTYATTRNDIYKDLDNNDCTNFVSQATAVGGVYSFISDYDGVPSLFQDWICEDNPNAWYMIKKERAIGYDYWVYSRSWTFVNDFRNFHTARAAAGSNTFSGKLSAAPPYTTTNESANFEYKLRKYAEVGQVWQLDGRHSIIITRVTQMPGGYNYVWYSAHSNNVQNGDIQQFLNFCWQNKNTTIYRLRFS